MDFEDKLAQLHKSLMTLVHNGGFLQSTREQRLYSVLEHCAHELQVARASVWTLNETSERIVCEQVFSDPQRRVPEPGTVLRKADYPIYFEAIQSNRLLHVEDAETDPVTVEVRRIKRDRNIKSMLDAPVFSQGRLSGILSLEHAGEKRRWDIAELSFVASVADTISLINEHESWSATRQRLEFIEQRDSLTGLENRRFFQMRLDTDCSEAGDKYRLRTLVLLGIDGFTSINDSYGARIADRLLRLLSSRFQELNRKHDCHIARVGGDQFAFWFTDVSDEASIQTAIECIQSCLKHPVSIIGKTPIDVSGSIGVFTYQNCEIELDDPLRCAEIALEKSKQKARGGVTHFSREWLGQLQKRRGEEQELLQAFERKELLPYYQPIVEAGTGQIVGAEALVRWQHPERGLIPPNRFLPILAKLGLMKRLGLHMVRHAFADLHYLRQQGRMLNWMSVNLAAEQLNCVDLIPDLEKLLAKYTDIDSTSIEFEVVEELIGADTTQVRNQIDALSGLGFRLSIDDFGTGFSSLSRLKHLPVSKIKIDKSFIDGLPDSENDQCIGRSIIGLAKGMKLALVAEGVENREQVRWLVDHGCDLLQGYLFYRPMPLADLNRCLQDHQAEDMAEEERSFRMTRNGNVVELILYGALNVSDYARMEQELQAFPNLLGNAWASLVDASRWKPGSLEVQKRIEIKTERLIETGLRREAYILGGSDLASYQIELMTPPTRDGYERRFFENRELAERWLGDEGFGLRS